MAVQIKTTKKFKDVFPHVAKALVEGFLPGSDVEFIDNIGITVSKSSIALDANDGGYGITSNLAFMPGTPHKILSGEVVVDTESPHFQPVCFAVQGMYHNLKQAAKGLPPKVDVTQEPVPDTPIEMVVLDQDGKSKKVKFKLPSVPYGGNPLLSDLNNQELSVEIPKAKVTDGQGILLGKGSVHLNPGVDLSGLVMPEHMIQGAIPVPLMDASLLYQPVKGTSSGSRYYVVAIHPACKVAARYKHGKLSVRLEGEMAGKVAPAIKAESSGSHCSVHLGVPPDEVCKVVGSMLTAMDLEWITPTPKVGKILGE